MIIKNYLYFILFLIPGFASAQNDSIRSTGGVNLIKIIQEVKSYKIDTADVPNDKITRKIIELKNVKHSISVNDIIMYKINEEEQKKEKPKEVIIALKEEFTTGRGKRLLDNATIWIYRQQFTYKQLKQLVRFYKTAAGQKLSEVYTSITLKTIMATEIIHDEMEKKYKARK